MFSDISSCRLLRNGTNQALPSTHYRISRLDFRYQTCSFYESFTNEGKSDVDLLGYFEPGPGEDDMDDDEDVRKMLLALFTNKVDFVKFINCDCK